MKMLSLFIFGVFLLLSTYGLAQVDIYQSDAYSVEEMCARQAAETNTTDYNIAYHSCIEKNEDRPMYQPDSKSLEEKLAKESDSVEDAIKSGL